MTCQLTGNKNSTAESPSSGTTKKDMSIFQCQNTSPERLYNTITIHAESNNIVHLNQHQSSMAKCQTQISKMKISPLNKEEAKLVQRVVGIFHYYVRALDMTILHAMSSIASEQPEHTKPTMHQVNQLLDYMYNNSDIVIIFYCSNMILNVHAGVSFPLTGKGRSHTGGYIFLGNMARDNILIQLNGTIHVTCAVLKLVALSAAGAELGTLWVNKKEAKVMQLTLSKLGHSKPSTPIHVDNTIAVVIVNHTIKKLELRAINMR